MTKKAIDVFFEKIRKDVFTNRFCSITNIEEYYKEAKETESLKIDTQQLTSPVTFYKDELSKIFRQYYPNLTYRIEAVEAAEKAFEEALQKEREFATIAIDTAMVNLAETILETHK